MDKQIITFSANEQNLVRIGGECHYSSDKVSYVEAHFDLGQNWSGYDSIRAVWFTDFVRGISTVLDADGVCLVPTEVLKNRCKVMVNLVGSISDGDVLTDRITTYPIPALVVDAKAKVESTETAQITPSQFDQFVSIVRDEVANIKDIVSTTLNADYTLTFVYSDGTSYTTPSIRGERGPQGADGADGTDGNGIASAVLNSNYTLTLTFTDGTSYTTPSIRGAQGPKGDLGDVSQAQLDAAVSDLKSDIDKTDDAFYSFAYGLQYLTHFTTGTYKWYPMEIEKDKQIALRTLDGSTYNNGALLEYNGYAGTQLGTIYPTIIGDTAYFKIDQDGVKYIRTGSDFSHGATDVFLLVNGLNAAQKIDKLEAQATASTSDIRHLFGFEFGDINSSGAFVASQRRMATPSMQHYEYDIIIPKRNGYTACGLCVYDDASGTNPRIVGLVNRYYDYLLQAGTYFRLYIYNPDNTQIVNGKPYDNLIYNDFHAYNRNASEAFVHGGDYKDNYLYNRNVRSVCHRGASRTAPENTLPAFIEARRWGFEWVEADIAWTADSVPVILHDTTIDRTSDGSGSISSLTYDQIKNLDFGSWFSSEYEGTKIPKLEELMQLCRKVGLKARLDINHASTGTQLEDACRLVVRNGMKDNVEFIGYDVQTLERIKIIIPTATLIYLVNTVNSQAVTDALSLKTDNNEVHLLTQTINSTIVELCANALIPLEYWTAGTFDKILELDPYVTVVTAEDSYAGIPLVAGSILYKSVIN